MKKRLLPVILAVCLLIGACPIYASAKGPDITPYYSAYTAIGDSICAGFSQPDYNYSAGWDMSYNIENSPAFCYANVAGRTLGSDVFNLGKCGCDTTELLAILSDSGNANYATYRQYIGSSDLITLEIGSNDLLFDVCRAILGCVNPAYANVSNSQLLAMVEPFMTGEASVRDFEAILAAVKDITGENPDPLEVVKIALLLQDDSLSAIMQKSYEKFTANLPLIIEKIHEINPSAELVVLGYYNPYPDVNYSYHYEYKILFKTIKVDFNFNIGNTIQTFVDRMNSFTDDLCGDDYLFVDISDTFTNAADPHPSAVGHAQIAAKILDAVLSTITVPAECSETISPYGPCGVTYVKQHGTSTFTITPASGDMITNVYIDGVKVDSASLTALGDGSYTYTFTDVTSDHTISADFLPAETPAISITAGADLDFGTVFTDDAVPDAQTVTIENTGVSTVDLSAPVNANFTFDLDKTELAPGETATLTVQPVSGIAPTDYSGSLDIEAVGDYGAGTTTASFDVSYTVINHTYIITADAETLDFGTVLDSYTTAPAAKTVTIENTGNTAVTLDQPTSTNFIIGALSETALDPGDTATFTVQPKTGFGIGNYDGTIQITGSNGASETVDVKFTVEEDYKYTTKLADTTGITVAGLMKSDVQLVISPLALGDDAGSHTIQVMQGSSEYTFLAGWNIELTGDYTGSFTIKLPVDAKYNGMTVTILHASSSGLHTYFATVTDGYVTITVSDFSPFAIFVKNDSAPKTGDQNSALLWLPLGISAGGFAVLATARIIRRRKDK